MVRWILFFLVILIGFAAGLYYGWEIRPLEQEQTSLATMRMDYQTDYVLMVSEAYQVEENPARAVERLSPLGEPLEKIRQAQEYAQRPGYSELDRRLLHELYTGLQTALTAGQ